MKSKCCKYPVDVVHGKYSKLGCESVTQWYECMKCGQPCDCVKERSKCKAAVALGKMNTGHRNYTEQQREAARQRMIALNVKRWQKQYKELMTEEKK